MPANKCLAPFDHLCDNIARLTTVNVTERTPFFFRDRERMPLSLRRCGAALLCLLTPGCLARAQDVLSSPPQTPATPSAVQEQQNNSPMQVFAPSETAAPLPLQLGPVNLASPSGLPIWLWEWHSIVAGPATQLGCPAGFAGNLVQSGRPLDAGLYADLVFLFQQQLPGHGGSIRADWAGERLMARLVFQRFTELCLHLRSRCRDRRANRPGSLFDRAQCRVSVQR